MPVSPTSYSATPSVRVGYPGVAGGGGRKYPKDDLGDGELDERRVSQREKQIGYGTNTDGYRNMLRLIAHDPRLKNGKVLPLEPPGANLKVSKRTWDLNIRRWRRALHMFDYIYIEGEDDQKTTLADVVELQRQQWVNPEYVHVPKINRVKHRMEDIMAARNKPGVPKKIPLEDNLVTLLKDPLLMHESVNQIQTMGVSVSPQNAGYKVLIGPNQGAGTSGGGGGGNSPTSYGAGNSPLAGRGGQGAPPPALSAIPVGGANSAVRRTSPVQFETPHRGTVGAGRHRNVDPPTASRSGGSGGNSHQQQRQRALSPLTQEGRPLSPVMMMTQPKKVGPGSSGNSPTSHQPSGGGYYRNSSSKTHSPTSYQANTQQQGGGRKGSDPSFGVVSFPSSLDDSLNQGSSPTHSTGGGSGFSSCQKRQQHHQDPTAEDIALSGNSNNTRTGSWRGGTSTTKRGTSPQQQQQHSHGSGSRKQAGGNQRRVGGAASADFGSWRK